MDRGNRFLTIIGLAMGAACQGTAAIIIPHISGSGPTIDGMISGDAGWAGANVVGLDFVNADTLAVHTETAYLCYDDSWLYIGFQTHFADTGWDFWEGVYIDGNNDGALTATASSNPTVDLHVACRGPSAWPGYDHYAWLGTGTWGTKSDPPGTLYKSAAAADVAFEYRISLADMAQAPGGTFGMWVNNGTQGGINNYQYQGQDYDHPERWGKFQLGPASVPEPFTMGLMAAGCWLGFARARRHRAV